MNIFNGNRKKITLLAALALFWGGLLVWQFQTWREPVRVPLTNVSGRSPAPSDAQNLERNLRVQLDLFEASRSQQEMVFGTLKNIFALSGMSETVREGTVENVDTMARQQSAAAELSQFHYLGFVRMGEVWERKPELAVLTRNEDLHVVMKGQTMDNRVLVKAITQEGVTLLDKDSRVEYTVLLSEDPLTQ